MTVTLDTRTVSQFLVIEVLDPLGGYVHPGQGRGTCRLQRVEEATERGSSSSHSSSFSKILFAHMCKEMHTWIYCGKKSISL
jgi:hypothetical protein